MSTVLVTGANGFVGRHLVPHLSAQGHTVRAATRRPCQIDGAASNVVIGSLEDRKDWISILSDVDVVIHLAARVHELRRQRPEFSALYTAINVEATRHLAGGAAQVGVKRFVFLSTVKVLGERTDGSAWTMDDPADPRGEYSRSKWAAELALHEELRDTSVSVAVIRPPLVYGPGVGANFLRLMRLVYKRTPLPFLGIDNRRSMINLWNLCDVMQRVAFERTSGVSTYLVSDGDDASTPGLVRLMGDALHRPARLFRVPKRLMRGIAIFTGFADEWQRLSESLCVDISETSRQLSWQPAVSLEDGIRRTVAWFMTVQGR